MEVLAIIPARGGSKSVSHKNLRLVGGKPLITHAVEGARAAMCVLMTKKSLKQHGLPVLMLSCALRRSVEMMPQANPP